MADNPPKATERSPSAQEWITRSEAAQILRISPHTFDKYRRQGKIERYRTPGSHPRYRRADVVALLTPQDDEAREAG